MQPTYRNRIAAMDVLRGFAVLGILLANIPAFGQPLFEEIFSGIKPVLSTPDRWAEAFTYAFVSGKFRSSLAILFGVGLYLQYAKRKEEGSWPGGYIKRNFFLGLLGLAHGLLIWYGDILFVYSLVAFVCVWFAPVSSQWLRRWIWILSVGTALLAAAVAYFTFAFPEAAGSSSPFGNVTPPWPFGPNDELLAFSNGSYLDQVRARLFLFPVTWLGTLAIGPALVTLFLLGSLFARSGVLKAPSQHPKTRNAALAVGFGLGLPLNLLAFTQVGVAKPADLTPVWELFIGPLMAPGYVMLVAVAVEKRWSAAVADALGKVGRIALTSYLSQSVICTAIFYSWGGGVFGQLQLWQMLLIVPLVWIWNIAFAHWWLARFDIGPMEWLLRSLTEGRAVPWKAPAAVSSPAAVPEGAPAG